MAGQMQWRVVEKSEKYVRNGRISCDMYANLAVRDSRTIYLDHRFIFGPTYAMISVETVMLKDVPAFLRARMTSAYATLSSISIPFMLCEKTQHQNGRGMDRIADRISKFGAIRHIRASHRILRGIPVYAALRKQMGGACSRVRISAERRKVDLPGLRHHVGSRHDWWGHLRPQM